MNVLRLGETVMLQLPSGEVRSIKLDLKANINLGKFGSFPATQLVGKQAGFTYEIVDRTLIMLQPKGIEELDDTDANNELIMDGEMIQPLTFAEIEALKNSGAKAADIIKAQIELHANFDLKTEYSKDKYKKRKEAKFSKHVTVIESTMFNVCDYWFTKDPVRARYLRPDTLAQMMNLANVHHGQRYIVVDDTGGLVLASVIDRLGGFGRASVISDVSHAMGYPVLANMNFAQEHLRTLDMTMNWQHTDEEWSPNEIIPSTMHGHSDTFDSALPSQKRIARENQRVSKRRETFLSLQTARDELFAGEWDGIIIASQYDPSSIVQRLSKYLGGSAAIVIHSPHLHVLTIAQNYMRSDTDNYLAPNISEGWLRKYQVLPGRTHPEMTTSGSGGYLLHCTKIFGNIAVKSTLADERRIHRQKLAEAKRRRKALSKAEVEPSTQNGNDIATTVDVLSDLEDVAMASEGDF